MNRRKRKKYPTPQNKMAHPIFDHEFTNFIEFRLSLIREFVVKYIQHICEFVVNKHC